MSVELIQLAYYVGFVALGWWLRHKGIAVPNTPSPAAPSTPVDQGALVDLLKAMLDRLAPPAGASPSTTGNVVHVPIEVAANVKQPQS
jgi:hypothetical protein